MMETSFELKDLCSNIKLKEQKKKLEEEEGKIQSYFPW